MHEAAEMFTPTARSQGSASQAPFAAPGAARPLWRCGARRVGPAIALAIVVAAGMAPASSQAAASSICSGCELFLGIGNTYHFWSDTGGLVIPVTLTFDDNRYEAGVFRMTSRQTLYEEMWGKTRVMAEPYWGFSLSRRWQLAARPTWRLFFGLGASYKTEQDLLDATSWNFAEQLAVRLHHPFGGGADMEFAIRHWSNGGLRCPNRGQDFFTVTVKF